MNNAPKIEAFNSFYQQAKSLHAAGHMTEAREMFLKAGEVANDISKTSTSYDVKMEYHKLAVKMLDFAKTKCVKTESVRATGVDEEADSKPSFTSESTANGITFNDVAGLDDVKEQIIFHVLEPMCNPELAEAYGIKPGGKILLDGHPAPVKPLLQEQLQARLMPPFMQSTVRISSPSIWATVPSNLINSLKKHSKTKEQSFSLTSSIRSQASVEMERVGSMRKWLVLLLHS